uniref:Uncharacterized protein n=1 Tax=Romanomermis culicivorax TaxID=13658 RepID=A0A915II29_ROMCU
MVAKEKHECFMKTRQDQEIEPNNLGRVYKHIPNLCIGYRRCDTCRNEPLGTCSYCGVNRHEFIGDDCLKKFGYWLFPQEHRGAIALAHNARGWHGCPTCIPKRFHTIADGRKAEEAFQATIKRKKFLEGKGYTLTEKWECELRKELK